MAEKGRKEAKMTSHIRPGEQMEMPFFKKKELSWEKKVAFDFRLLNCILMVNCFLYKSTDIIKSMHTKLTLNSEYIIALS